jgi:hypothetical protein
VVADEPAYLSVGVLDRLGEGFEFLLLLRELSFQLLRLGCRRGLPVNEGGAECLPVAVRTPKRRASECSIPTTRFAGIMEAAGIEPASEVAP